MVQPDTDILHLLWRGERAAPGQRAGLTLGGIVANAVAFADVHGLEALSMAKLARELGFSTMALYRHVPTKSDLLTLMFDAGVGVPPESIFELSGWRARLHALADAYVEIFDRRPWLIDIPITGPPMGPNNLRWLETGLTILAEPGLSPGQQLEVFMTFTSFMLGSVRLAIEMERAAGATKGTGEAGTTPPTYGASLRALLPPGKLPQLEAVIAAGVFDDGGDEDDVHPGLELLLDGVEAQMRRRCGDEDAG